MTKDIRFALCMLRSHRWGSLAVIITIALGIGINTTVFTLVNAVLFKPVPIPAGERLVTVAHQNLRRPTKTPALPSQTTWNSKLKTTASKHSKPFIGRER
jgi:hypothetical protein